MRKTDRAGLLVESARNIVRSARTVWQDSLLKLPIADSRQGTSNHDVLFAYPGHLRPGSAEHGSRILEGNFSFVSGRVKRGERSPFSLTPPSAAWAQE